MNHKGTIEIKTERLVLRRFTVEDAEIMFNSWANDPDVTKFLSFEPHGNIAVTKELLNDWVNEYKNLNTYNWAIVFHGKLVGSISFLNPNEDTCEAEAGYCMAKEYWGRGIMAEAFSAILCYAFNEVGFLRIFAKHNVDNPNSGKVMKKSGMNYLETRNAPLALKPETIVMCDCYEALNPNRLS